MLYRLFSLVCLDGDVLLSHLNHAMIHSGPDEQSSRGQSSDLSFVHKVDQLLDMVHEIGKASPWRTTAALRWEDGVEAPIPRSMAPRLEADIATKCRRPALLVHGRTPLRSYRIPRHVLWSLEVIVVVAHDFHDVSVVSAQAEFPGCRLEKAVSVTRDLEQIVGELEHQFPYLLGVLPAYWLLLIYRCRELLVLAWNVYAVYRGVGLGSDLP